MYILVKISPIGRRSAVASDFDPDGLIAAGEALQKKFPGEQFGVADDVGFFVWPERLSKAHVNPERYCPIEKQEYV